MDNKNIPKPPSGGVYGDEDVYKAYSELYQSVHLFMSEVNKDSSYGALGLGGVASKARARAKSLVSRAKNLEDIVKAVCVGRK